MNTTFLRLHHGDASAEICPSLGGTILRFSWRGIPILRPSDGIPPIARLTACYPLLPFSNRIANGRLSFAGTTHAIPQTVDYAPLPMHGLAWQRPWEVRSHGDDHALLTQHYAPDGDAPAWPFPYAAEQVFTLDDHGLHIALSMRNTGATPAPAGLGWHPYFPRTPRTRIWADVEEMWVNNEASLPLRLERAAAALATGQLAAETDYDNVFRGFKGRARVVWPERDAAVTLRTDAALSHLVIFTPVDKPHLAVEPVTHMTDAFNRYTAAGGHGAPGIDANTGTVVLAPDATLKVSMSLLPSHWTEGKAAPG
jgi:aldose 1-epimerase